MSDYIEFEAMTTTPEIGIFTAPAFNYNSKVWIMRENRPIEVYIVAYTIKGSHTDKRLSPTISSNYVVNREQDKNKEHQLSFDHNPDTVYATKEELLDSFR